MSRWWGLDRRQTVLALVAAALVGALLVAVVNLSGSGVDSTPIARDEVWVFGSRTVAAPPSLLGTRKVAGTGFGSVVGAPGRVWMYEAGSRQLGWYDGATSRIERLAHAPGGSNHASTALPLLAPLDGDLWLAPSPGELARYDVDRERVVDRISTVEGAAPDATNGVVVGDGSVVSAVATVDGLAIHVVDPGTGTVLRSAMVSDFGPLRGLAADGHDVWLLGDGRAMRFVISSLRISVDTRLDPAPDGAVSGAVGGAVVVRHDLYLLRGADQLVRVRADGSSGVVSQLRGTGDWPPALNASLVAGRDRVYALVPVGVTADDHSARLLGFDAVRGRATRALEFSSAFFAGGLAFSTR